MDVDSFVNVKGGKLALMTGRNVMRLLAFLCGLALAPGSLYAVAVGTAVGQELPEHSGSGAPSGANRQIVKASDLLYKEVYSNDGRRLGVIKELLIDDDGTVRYLLVSYGGFLGMGSRLTAVPWKAAEPLERHGEIVIHVSVDELTGAPNLAEGGGSSWMAEVNRYFRVAPPAKQLAQLPPEVTFARIDKNSDGLISRSEAQEYSKLNDRFGEVDTDHSGTLSPAEFSAFETTATSANCNR